MHQILKGPARPPACHEPTDLRGKGARRGPFTTTLCQSFFGLLRHCCLRSSSIEVPTSHAAWTITPARGIVLPGRNLSSLDPVVSKNKPRAPESLPKVAHTFLSLFTLLSCVPSLVCLQDLDLLPDCSDLSRVLSHPGFLQHSWLAARRGILG